MELRTKKGGKQKLNGKSTRARPRDETERIPSNSIEPVIVEKNTAQIEGKTLACEQVFLFGFATISICERRTSLHRLISPPSIGESNLLL